MHFARFRKKATTRLKKTSKTLGASRSIKDMLHRDASPAIAPATPVVKPSSAPTSSQSKLRNCGTISFKIRPGRRFPDIVGHESCKNWQQTYFYGPDIPLAGREVTYPNFVDGAAAEVSTWRSHASLPSDLDASRAIRRI